MSSPGGVAVTRRRVLVGALAAGGLAVGYALRPQRYTVPLQPGRNEVAFDAWIKVSAEGMVTVAVPQVEMGQGIATLIPQIAAWELGADWRQIAVEPAPADPIYANPVLAARWAEMWMPFAPWLADEAGSLFSRRWAAGRRFDATADGTSLAAYEAPVRAAAATARVLLCKAAAARWDVAWEECETRDGLVVHEGKRLSFGPLAAAAARLTAPDPAPLRSDASAEKPDDYPPGAPLQFPRLDLPSKVDGSFVFAGDVRLPDMVYAAIRHGPIGGAGLAGYDKDAAREVHGLLALVHEAQWVAAVASNWWAAEIALSRIDARFAAGDARHSPADASADDKSIKAAMDRALLASGNSPQPRRLHTAGDPDTYLTGRLPHEVRYDVAPALHATIETATATARFTAGRLELWVGTQAPGEARRTVARALALNEEEVVLYPMPIGGSFDRRLEHDHAIEVAKIARACRRPVQLVWSRRQEHMAGWPRPPASAVLGANVDAEGNVGGWRARIAVPPAALEFGRRLLDADASVDAIAAVAGNGDLLAIEGAVPPYAIRHLAIDHAPVRLALPSGRLRGNAHGYTAFFNESFIDELAHAAGHDPLSYRMALLGQDPRLAECLQRAAALAEWGGGGDGTGQGIACHAIGNGRIAVIASARMEDEGLRVDRLSAVVDIGRIINLDIARQQVEGGLIFGLGLALGCSPGYERGLPISGRLSALGLPVLADCPEAEVDFIDSGADAADPGELGVAVAAPAVANALFSATGVRLRRLPLLSEDA